MGEAGKKKRLVAGETLGPFLLVEKLALGGMAEIWHAERDGESVALKILQPMFAKEKSFRAMFQDEVNIATKLTHANIVQVFGVHEEDGLVFQSMELIAGKDLRRLLSGLARAGQWFPVRHALYVGQQIARALSYAHVRRGEDGRPLGIVHRDVSPHNVMIAADGRVKLFDFGIARAAERLAHTRPGVVKGKIPYMAPEQALAVGVTPQTDVFATGVVMWEMLAMRRLFRGESDPELLEQVVRAEVPPLVEQNTKVPEDVAALIHEMLAQRAADRPASMQEVENSLTRMIARHFGAVAQEDFAGWVAPFVEEQRRAPTMALPAQRPEEEADPTEPTSIPADEKTMPVPAEDTLQGADPSGQTALVSAPDATLPDQDTSTDGIRMPSRSEIVRAVDSVPTMPVRAGPSVEAEGEQRVEVKSAPIPAAEPAVADTVAIESGGGFTEDAESEDAGGAAGGPATVTLPEVTPPPPRVEPDEKPGQTSLLPLLTVGLALVVVLLLAALVLGD